MFTCKKDAFLKASFLLWYRERKNKEDTVIFRQVSISVNNIKSFFFAFMAYALKCKGRNINMKSDPGINIAFYLAYFRDRNVINFSALYAYQMLMVC